MSQTEVAPVLPGYSSGPPPDYNVTAVATERVIASTLHDNGPPPPSSPAGPVVNVASAAHSPNAFRTSRQTTPSSSLPPHQSSSASYTVHSNSHILVILPRSGRTSSRSRSPPLPAYGRQATVSGSLFLTPGSWTSTVSKVAISLEGQASSVLLQHAMREPASSRKLFSTLQILWKNTADNTLNLPDKMKFEVQFPPSIPGGRERHNDLPPSFEQKTQMVFGIATHVKIEYTLRVDVWRRGLWRHKRKVHVPLRSTLLWDSYIYEGTTDWLFPFYIYLKPIRPQTACL